MHRWLGLLAMWCVAIMSNCAPMSSSSSSNTLAPQLPAGMAPVLSEIWPNFVRPGQEVRIAGKHFTPGMRLHLEGLGDSPVFQYIDEDCAKGYVPDGAGEVYVTIEMAGGEAGKTGGLPGGSGSTGGGEPNGTKISYNTGLEASNEGVGFGGEVSNVIAVNQGGIPPLYAATAGGVYISEDDGATWQQRSLGLKQASARKIVAAPTDPECLYVCTGVGDVFVSHDRGEAWRRIEPPAGGLYCWDLAVHPKDSNQLFVISGGLIFHWNGVAWGELGGGRSVWNIWTAAHYLYGVSGYDANGALRFDLDTGSSELVGPQIGFEAIKPSPVTQGLMYAVAGASDQPTGLYRSTDFGTTWTWVSPSNLVQPDPTLPDRVYEYDGTEVSVSDDRGQTFTPLHSHTSLIHDLALVPGRLGEGWLASDEGLTHFMGTTWEQDNEGLAAVHVLDLAAAPSRPDRIYLAAGARGLYRSDDGGASWKRAKSACAACQSLTPWVQSVAVDPANPDLIVISDWEGAYRSMDAGDTWEPVTRTPSYFPAKIGFDGHLALVPATSPLCCNLSNDGGRTFQQLSDELGREVAALRVFDGVAFAVTTNGLFSRSPGDSNWVQWIVNPDGWGIDVIRRPDGSLIYATNVHLFRCAATACEMMLVSPARSGSITAVALVEGSLFVGTQYDGLYRADPLMSGWSPWVEWNFGLGQQYVTSIVAPRGQIDGMLVGTSGGGVFRVRSTP